MDLEKIHTRKECIDNNNYDDDDGNLNRKNSHDEKMSSPSPIDNTNGYSNSKN